MIINNKRNYVVLLVLIMIIVIPKNVIVNDGKIYELSLRLMVITNEEKQVR